MLRVPFMTAAAAVLALLLGMSAQAQGQTWSGQWSTTFGTMTLTQTGAAVEGTYTYDQGHLVGSASGAALAGRWDEAPTRAGPVDAGPYEFTLTGSLTTFSGRWRHDADATWFGEWSGTCMAGPCLANAGAPPAPGPPPPPPTEPPPPPAPGPPPPPPTDPGVPPPPTGPGQPPPPTGPGAPPPPTGPVLPPPPSAPGAPPACLTAKAAKAAKAAQAPSAPACPPRFDPAVIAHFPADVQPRVVQILGNYYSDIPVGPMRASLEPLLGRKFKEFGLIDEVWMGYLNNMASVASDTYGQSRCGDYQDKVLQLLNGIRFSADPQRQALMGGVEYGPIETLYNPTANDEFAAHHAVVLYPSGTDWRSTGIVLDPWATQRPEVESIQSWRTEHALQARPSSQYPGVYPISGGSAYPGAPTPKPAAPRPNRAVVVRSPVAVQMYDARGTIGVGAGGGFRDTLRAPIDANFSAKDGGYDTSLLFRGGEQTIRLRAVGDGQVHVYAAAGRYLRAFRTVRVREGQRLTLEWDRGAGAPVLRKGRRTIGHTRRRLTTVVSALAARGRQVTPSSKEPR